MEGYLDYEFTYNAYFVTTEAMLDFMKITGQISLIRQML